LRQTGVSGGESAVTRWLRRAPRFAFALYGGLAGFGAYSAMYAFRKPFTAARYEHVAGWPFLVDFKTAIIIAQVAGYALSKLIGIKIVSEMPGARRAAAILALVGIAEVALVGFAVLPTMAGVGALFVNGLTLGLIWGLVFGFLEGRRLTEVLGAMLCASFILSSGVVKSAGEAVMLAGWADERWMPAATGLLFTPLLLLSVWALAQLPPPDARDQAERAPRVPMDRAQRRRLFGRYAPSLIALLCVYVMLTALRDFRDNFAVDVWRELGFAGVAGIFTWTELPVTAVVLLSMALLVRVRDNRAAVFWNLALIAFGFALVGAATLAFQTGVIGAVAWMIVIGAGVYFAYIPFNALLFDRLMATTAVAGNAGFLIYVADACGYAGSVALLVFRTFGHVTLDWSSFLCGLSYVTCAVGLGGTAIGAVTLRRAMAAETREPGR
jgi:hypothetical protein